MTWFYCAPTELLPICNRGRYKYSAPPELNAFGCGLGRVM
jgi:hypothetical protein